MKIMENEIIKLYNLNIKNKDIEKKLNIIKYSLKNKIKKLRNENKIIDKKKLAKKRMK